MGRDGNLKKKKQEEEDKDEGKEVKRMKNWEEKKARY